jgi:hypothetical protein
VAAAFGDAKSKFPSQRPDHRLRGHACLPNPKAPTERRHDRRFHIGARGLSNRAMRSMRPYRRQSQGVRTIWSGRIGQQPVRRGAGTAARIPSTQVFCPGGRSYRLRRLQRRSAGYHQVFKRVRQLAAVKNIDVKVVIRLNLKLVNDGFHPRRQSTRLAKELQALVDFEVFDCLCRGRCGRLQRTCKGQFLHQFHAILPDG